MLAPFSSLLTFRTAELTDDIELLFIDVTILKPLGGISPGRYDSASFNFNTGEANVYNHEGTTLATGRFEVTPTT